LIFFVYPSPKGSKEPSQTLISCGSSITPAPGGAKNRIRYAGELGAAKINLLPYGDGVNKLIFNRI
jgi:hypothetical protein